MEVIQNEITTLWMVFISTMGGCVLYAILAVIWYMKLNGKVEANYMSLCDKIKGVEKVVELYIAAAKERDERIEKDMDNLFDLTRKIENIVARIEGRENGRSRDVQI